MGMMQCERRMHQSTKAVLLSEIALPKYAVQVLCLLLRECLDSVSGLSQIFGSIDDSVLSNQSAMYPA